MARKQLPVDLQSLLVGAAAVNRDNDRVVHDRRIRVGILDTAAVAPVLVISESHRDPYDFPLASVRLRSLGIILRSLVESVDLGIRRTKFLRRIGDDYRILVEDLREHVDVRRSLVRKRLRRVEPAAVEIISVDSADLLLRHVVVAGVFLHHSGRSPAGPVTVGHEVSALGMETGREDFIVPELGEVIIHRVVVLTLVIVFVVDQDPLAVSVGIPRTVVAGPVRIVLFLDEFDVARHYAGILKLVQDPVFFGVVFDDYVCDRT